MSVKKCTVLIPFLFVFINLATASSPPYSDQDCLFCHGKPDLTQITTTGAVRSIFVNPEEWSQDIHRKSNMTCVDCHTNANPFLHFREGFLDVDCARCHPEEAEEYQKNIHTTFTVVSPNKELPLCYHCHTKHHILRHDDPASSVHERNVGVTCGNCHPEVMVKGILKGASLGKISGHRKGDLSEKFDMKVCINCHYHDSAHGAKRVYKDFCVLCHDVRTKGGFVLGPTHLDNQRWVWLNYVGAGSAALLLLGTGFIVGYRRHKGFLTKIRPWLKKMKVEESPPAQDKTQN